MSGSKNTLFNYFKKISSPSTAGSTPPSTPKSATPATPLSARQVGKSAAKRDANTPVSRKTKDAEPKKDSEAKVLHSGDGGQSRQRKRIRLNYFLGLKQNCQMVYFQTKKPNFGKFWRALDWEMLIYIMVIWNILWTFGIFYDPLVHFAFILYIFSGLGIMHQEKSGNLGLKQDCQMVKSGTKNPVGIENVGFTGIWNIVRSFSTFCARLIDF
jgi:hypothetical protein